MDSCLWGTKAEASQESALANITTTAKRHNKKSETHLRVIANGTARGA